MASNNPNSPRQKMINLMYLVFIAMLALNVSSEVLDGFDLVEDGLQQTIKSTVVRNDLVIGDIERAYTANKEKAGEWYNKAEAFKKETDSLYNRIQNLKVSIVKEADGEDGDLDNIKHKDDLNAAGVVMLSPTDNKAAKLKQFINKYREYAITLVSDPAKKKTIAANLTTKASSKAKDGKNWEQSLFEEMPASAAITLLTKIQSDVRLAEGEVLTDLRNNIDADDYRVTTLQAHIIPNSMIVMQGQSFTGQIVLSAVDSTKRPQIFVGSTHLEDKDGKFSFAAGAPGPNKELSGYVLWGKAGQEPVKYPFSTKYTVVPPVATIEVANMNVLYTNYSNKLSISVPGVPNDRVTARIKDNNASIIAENGAWVVKPVKSGQNVTVVVTADGQSIEKVFKVRPLPDPIAYIEFTDANGSPRRFKGGKIDKATIVAATGVKSAIDDGVLDLPFTVLRFRTDFQDGMGNTILEVSNGANFSERQKEQIRKLGKGKRFYISDVKVTGPDGGHDLPTSVQVEIK